MDHPAVASHLAGLREEVFQAAVLLAVVLQAAVPLLAAAHLRAAASHREEVPQVEALQAAVLLLVGQREVVLPEVVPLVEVLLVADLLQEAVSHPARL